MAAKITIVNFRKKLIDIDNISAKAVIDGLVHAGVLVDDSPEFVSSVTTKQLWSKDERTIIQITWGEQSDE